MSAVLGWYVPGRSWLHRLDPRVKLVFMLVGNALLLTQLAHILPLVLLVAIHAALLSARVPPSRLVRLWRAVLPLLLVIMLVQPLFSPSGRTLFSLWLVRLTDGGLLLGLAFALRLAALGFCWYLLLLTTRETDLVQALVRLGLPGAWGMMVALALRYPATLGALYASVLDAQRSRGLRLEGRGLLGRARAQLPVLIAMLVSAIRSIDRLAMALDARGFGARPRRTSLHPLRFRPTDWIALVALLVASAAVVLIQAT
ncbi:MAG TPA: energy-coupling factor transporter transmembrane component T [Chloroflexota bacterium]|nr:energy-coupling factor transporter transmembrane component T [Chloroflexota bacterium]